MVEHLQSLGQPHRRSRLEPSKSLPKEARLEFPNPADPDAPTSRTPTVRRSFVHIPRGNLRNGSMNPYRGSHTIPGGPKVIHTGVSPVQTKFAPTVIPVLPLAVPTSEVGRRPSFRIVQSLVKALCWLVLGFGSGYAYSTWRGSWMENADAPVGSPFTMAPWGYSQADPLILEPPKASPEEERPVQSEEEETDATNNVAVASNHEKSKQAPQQVSQDPTPESKSVPSQSGTTRLRGGPEQPPAKTPDSWDRNQEKLVRVVNQSATKIRIYWKPRGVGSSHDWVPMTDPSIDPGRDFYLHARPTHVFVVVRDEPGNDTGNALLFTVLDQEEQTVAVQEDWRLEILPETGGTLDQ